MGRFSKRFFTTGTAVAVLAPMLFVALSVTAPGIASARCAGEGNYVRSTLIVGGRELVAEAPDRDTCDNDTTYWGHFAAKQPNWRAWVMIQNNGVWTPHQGSGYNMNNNGYHYGDGNSRSLMALCADDGTRTVCGWGSTYTWDTYPFFTIPASGVNYEF